jgi:hypothetical protein
VLEKMRYTLGTNPFPAIDFYGADGEEGDDPTDPPAGDGDGAGAPQASDPPTNSGEGSSDDDEYNARLKKESAGYRKRAQAAEAKLKELDEAKLSEAEKTAAKLDELSSSNTTLNAALREERINVALLSVAYELRFKDVNDVRGQVNFDDLEIGEDGRPDMKSLRDQLKKVAKAKPYLIDAPVIGSGDGGPTGDPVTPTDEHDETRKKYVEKFEREGMVRIPQ